MSAKLIWGILGGLVIGWILGASMDNTAIGIAICMAAGAVAAGIWHYMEQRRLHREDRP